MVSSHEQKQDACQKPRQARHKWEGQSLVEFAIILPVLLIVLFVLVELARVMHAWLAVENGARFGVRYAVTGEFDPAHCDTPGACSGKKDKQEARVDSIHDVAWSGSTSILRLEEGVTGADQPGFFQVTVCRPEDLTTPGSTFDTYGCGTGEFAGEPGERVSVVVEFNHPLIVPGLSSVWPQLRLSARRESTVETYHIVLSGGVPPENTPPAPPPSRTPDPTATVTQTIPDKLPRCEALYMKWPFVSEDRPYFLVNFDDANHDEGFVGEIVRVDVWWPADYAYLLRLQEIHIHEQDEDHGNPPWGRKQVIWKGNLKSDTGTHSTFPSGVTTYRYSKMRVFFAGVDTLEEASGGYGIRVYVKYPELVEPCVRERSTWVFPPPTPGPSPTPENTSPPRPTSPNPTSTSTMTSPPTRTPTPRGPEPTLPNPGD
jgi:hypothetical protein